MHRNPPDFAISTSYPMGFWTFAEVRCRTSWSRWSPSWRFSTGIFSSSKMVVEWGYNGQLYHIISWGYIRGNFIFTTFFFATSEWRWIEGITIPMWPPFRLAHYELLFKIRDEDIPYHTYVGYAKYARINHFYIVAGSRPVGSSSP